MSDYSASIDGVIEYTRVFIMLLASLSLTFRNRESQKGWERDREKKMDVFLL